MTDTRTESPKPPLLVTGATGMIGRLLVEALVDRDVELAVMLRPSSDAGQFEGLRGVTVVRGDFDDPVSLNAALTGVERTFLVTNSTERTEQQQQAFVRAAATAGVSHLVKLSQLHAAKDSPVRFLRYHAAVEAAVEQAGIPYTFVRPNLVLQAYLPFAGSVAAGVLPAPMDDSRVSVVDARDIAAVAAVALTQSGHEGRTYDVTGPAAVSHAEIAAVLAEVSGHDVRFEAVPEKAFVAMVEQAGMPPWQAEGLAEDYAHYRRGEAAVVSADVERVVGRASYGVLDFVRDHADAFGGR